MPITYTNRKDVTYYLCRGQTKTGKTRYYFGRDLCEDAVDEIPPGYAVSESVNGVVSLVRERPSQILAEELASVETAIRRHPRARRYRAAVKGKQIEVYERSGLDPDDMPRIFGRLGLPQSWMSAELDAMRERRAHYSPVLRFTLKNATSRTFRVERMCYRSSINGWLELFMTGSVADLAEELMPALGTDKFFDLW